MFYSGPTAITIDTLDTSVQAAGGAGAVVRAGIWQVSNQANPFPYTQSSVWATLLIDAGTKPTTSTGTQTWSFGAITIPAYTWFAVGGVDQVVLGTRYLGNYIGGIFSPWGTTGQPTYQAFPIMCLIADNVTGTLPTNFIPSAGAGYIDSGIGMHRAT